LENQIKTKSKANLVIQEKLKDNADVQEMQREIEI
jgi:hypothetical protein